MEVSTQPRLRFHGVDVVDVKFNSKNAYDNSAKIEIKISPQVFYPENLEKHFKILMEVQIVSLEFFSLTLVAIGNFELENELPEKVKKSFVNTNAPAIMFPYLRTFISTLTANLGNVTGTLTIPTQFFQGEIPEMKVDDNVPN